jgi:O-antigen/teichoic acid export membrane protein
LKETLAKNFIFIITTMTVQMLAMAFVTIGIARYLSVADFGQYSFIIALISSIMTIAHFGLQPIMIREIAVDRGNAGMHLGNAFLTRTAMLSIGALIIAIILKILHYHGGSLFAALFAMLSEFFVGISALSRAFFQAIERMEMETLVAAVFYGTLLTLIYLVFYFDLGFLAVFIAIFTANLIQVAVNFLLLRRFVTISFNMTRVFQFFFAESFILGIGILLRLNIPKIGTLLLKFMRNETEVAYYQASQGILTLIETLPAAMTIAFLPFLARLVRSSREELVSVYEKLFKVFISISLGITICLFFFPRDILTLIYGEKYLSSVPSLTIMSAMAVFLFMNVLISSMFVILSEQKYVLASAALAVIVSLVVSLATIQKYGYLGAAAATTLAYLTYFMMAIYFLVRLPLGITLSSVGKGVQKPLAAGTITTVLLAAQRHYWNTHGLAMAFAGAAIYCCLLIIFKVISREELVFMRDIVFRRNRPAIS